ncbi:MAG TPA: hypothetical protein VN719_14530, partial [Gemmatimonadales bacterium]|nr:hypothetical protein [Gemmatimonadales bacterium]
STTNAAVAFYCGTLFATSIAHNLLLEVAAHNHLLHDGITRAEISRVRRSYRLGLVVYAIATLVAAWSSVAGLVLATGLWLLWIPLSHRSQGEAHGR